MEVLSTESLEKLRRGIAEIKNPHEVVLNEFDNTIKNFHLSMVEFNADIPSLPELQLPTGKSQETNNDIENCKILHKHLTELTVAAATDERLWTTLCFREYAEYARERWPIDKAKKPANHILNHWFAKTGRNRMRDNAIGRLWWVAHVASRVPDISIDEVLKTLLDDSDYRQNLLDRTSSANSANVVAAILSISKEASDNGIDFEREKFRAFMKKVDFVGRRTALPSMSVNDLKALLSPIYNDAYGIPN